MMTSYCHFRLGQKNIDEQGRKHINTQELQVKSLCAQITGPTLLAISLNFEKPKKKNFTTRNKDMRHMLTLALLRKRREFNEVLNHYSGLVKKHGPRIAYAAVNT